MPFIFIIYLSYLYVRGRVIQRVSLSIKDNFFGVLHVIKAHIEVMLNILKPF